MKIQLPSKVSHIIETLIAHGYSAYAVGGCIRDSILGRIPNDWDITTSALPSQVKDIFTKTVDTGIQHGTVTVMIGGEGFEVTTYRIDGEYKDHRHPDEVFFTSDLIEDLRRRDFTINAMAYNEKDGLVDAFGGKEDLKRHIVRCVGIATERFQEDALRVLRGVRFAAQLDFSIEEETQLAMRKLACNLRDISAERIQVELVKLLESKNPQMLRKGYELGITKYILPELDLMMKISQNNPHHCYTVGEHTIHALQQADRNKVVRLAVLLHDVGKLETKTVDEKGISHFPDHSEVGAKRTREILRRLRFDNDTTNKVIRLVRWHDYRFPKDMTGIRKSIHQIGEDIFLDLLSVMHADVLAQSSYLQKEKLDELEQIREKYEEIKKQGQCLNIKSLALNGNDLKEAGIPEGKQLGESLAYLLDLVLEHPEWNTKDKLMECIQKRN